VSDQLDLVRRFYAAVNRGDLDALVAAYDPACIVEDVFIGDDAVYEGRAAVGARWSVELDRWSGALPGGRRIDVRRIAGIETGWGWVQAEWLLAVSPASGPGETLHQAGYSHFWIEDGLIRRHRTVARAVEGLDHPARSPSTRRYPERPIVGVGAVVIGADGRIVLVKRRHEPLAGQWSLPGGMLELGETLEAGTAREILEETGLVVDVGPVIEVFDRILVDDESKVRYHFVLVDYLCRPVAGTLVAGTDVGEVSWAGPAALAPYRTTEKVRAVVARALDIARGHSW
jgi:ADP-ribose pyrophosphatase YjhB (NUDIX family)